MNKRTLSMIVAALASAAASAPAVAQSRGFQPGYYLGFGFGQTHVSGGNQSGTVAGVPYTSSGFGDNKTTIQINGGYQIDPMWGFEVQYTDLGSRNGTITARGTTVRTPDIRAYQLGASGTATYMFTPEWFVRGKLGVSSNHIADTDVVIGGTSFPAGGGNKTDLLAGIGAGYKWSENLSTRLEYEHYGKFGSNNGATSAGSAGNLGLRMQYKF